MRNKCNAGFTCIQNVSIIIFCIIFLSIGYLIYSNVKSPINMYISDKKNNFPQNHAININNYSDYAGAYDNPYNPPLMNNDYVNLPIVPINVSTNVGLVNVSFRQLGILTPVSQNSKDNILPLMGKPLFITRNKYQYYTISNQNNLIKLPISIKGKSGLDEYGVDEVFDGDTVYVEGYDDVFKVTKYDNGTIKYLPL